MAYNAFLKIQGIDGEATQKGFEKAVEIFSFSWGASNPSSMGPGATGHGSGRVSISDFNFMKKSEVSSAKLFNYCCEGTAIPTITAHLLKSGGKDTTVEFLKYTFSDCVITSLQWSGSSGGDDQPTESVSIAFAKVEIDYMQQTTKDQKGKKAGLAAWDIAKNSAS
jgi:type VI secretion system secreted protein Hcp